MKAAQITVFKVRSVFVEKREIAQVPEGAAGEMVSTRLRCRRRVSWKIPLQVGLLVLSTELLVLRILRSRRSPRPHYPLSDFTLDGLPCG